MPLRLPEGQSAARFVALGACATPAVPPTTDAVPLPIVPADTADAPPPGAPAAGAAVTPQADRPAPIRIVPKRTETPSPQLSRVLGQLSDRAAIIAGPEFFALAPRSYTTRFDSDIAEVAKRNQIDPLLLHAIVRQESRYRSAARSPVGALGLMQIMPATGASLGTPASQLFDPAANLDTGARLLRRLNARYRGDLDLMLAAYNAGEGAVARYGNRVPPYRETREYIRKVKADYVRLAGENGLTDLSI